MTRSILLIDMDAFYAAVEQARRPELIGLPVVVGGKAESRGVVSTASYEARACGVRTAMPMAQAQRLCPQATFLPVDMKAYQKMQVKLLELFGRFTDQVEPVSIDEAFLASAPPGCLPSWPPSSTSPPVLPRSARPMSTAVCADCRWAPCSASGPSRSSVCAARGSPPSASSRTCPCRRSRRPLPSRHHHVPDGGG